MTLETELTTWLRGRLPRHDCAPLGLTDDAALLMWDGQQCVATVDMLNEGVDFRLAVDEPRRIGRKALAVNLSDLAAMAARPAAALVALSLPRDGGLRLARELYEGMIPLAEEFEIAIAGGDTNCWDGPLAIGVTAIGCVMPPGVWRRAGARSGDRILATGRFGGSILGRQFDFRPRVHEALLLHERYEIHAAIDVSDGLSLDLARLAAESGVGAELELSAVPISPDAFALSQRQNDGVGPLDHALADGEDFELLLAAAPEVASRIVADQPLAVEITDLGQFISEPGLWASGGERRPLKPRGYLHE